MCKFRPKDEISAQELMTRLKVKGIVECYRMQKPSGLVIQKDWKGVLGKVNEKPMLEVVFQRTTWENIE